MADAAPVNYGWFQGHLHRIAKGLWANEGRALLHTLFDKQQARASRGQELAMDDLPDSIRQIAAAWPPHVPSG
jgi:hypothetical protein